MPRSPCPTLLAGSKRCPRSNTYPDRVQRQAPPEPTSEPHSSLGARGTFGHSVGRRLSDPRPTLRPPTQKRECLDNVPRRSDEAPAIDKPWPRNQPTARPQGAALQCRRPFGHPTPLRFARSASEVTPWPPPGTLCSRRLSLPLPRARGWKALRPRSTAPLPLHQSGHQSGSPAPHPPM